MVRRRIIDLLLAGLLLLTVASAAIAEPRWLSVSIGDRNFTLEMALDPESRYRGLSERPPLAADGGMLFVFPSPGPVAFCMRDCAYPLDVAFLDPQGRLLAWTTMVPEPRRPGEGDREYEARLTAYPSPPATQFVIELAPGTLRGLALARGTTILRTPKALAAQAR